MIVPEHRVETIYEPDLDPRDWDETRALAHQMLDDMLDLLAGARSGPVWRPIPDETIEHLREPVPQKGMPLHTVYEAFKSHILPYPTGNLHPRFFGWVVGNGTVTGMLADMLASGMNPHLAGFNQSALHVEQEVMCWLAELMGYPESASGLLVSGGTMANLNGVAVARQMKAGFDVREEGLSGQEKPLTMYGSAQTHGWIFKACELMGLGRRGFRAVPVDDDFRLDIDACRRLIQHDLARGRQPFCIVGNAGTVNTGAVDDLQAIRSLADEFGLWFHVDGALGSLAALADDACHLVEGQELADSLAFDLHKWGYMPFEVACVLIRDSAAQTATFAQAPAYLTASRRGVSVDTTYFSDRGLQLSRSFRALKVWMSLKEQGVDLLGRVIQKNVDQAAYLAGLVEDHPALTLLAPVSLNIVCFRYDPGGLSNEALNALNEDVVIRIQESGIAVPSHTRLGDSYAIRVCIANHRTRRRDLDILVDAICDIGADAARGPAIANVPTMQ